MGRTAAHVLAKALIAGVASIAGTGGIAQAQAPARVDAPARMPGQAGVGPEFRAGRPLQLSPTDAGPTADAPLSFGRSRPPEAGRSPGGESPAPAASDSQASRQGAQPTPSPRQDVSVSSPPAARDASMRSPGDAVPAAAAVGREDEAKALARLRERLEQTLAQHAGDGARVEREGKALRVVSQGTVEASARVSPVRAATAAASHRKPAGRPTRPRDWSYSGDAGPAYWASLNPEWAACGADAPQSPIDIRDGIAVGLPAIEFDLPPAILTIRDDGRAIQAIVREGPAITVLGRRFLLREISFHQPAEFRVDGKGFDLSAHFLYRDEEGRAAIVVVLFEIGDQSSPRNPVVQAVLDYLPLARDMLMPVAERIDLAALLPANRGYYNFVGSLSTPPCTHGVIWMVMREPLRVPPSQVAIFARIHPMNVRPLQPLAGRLIKQSE